MLANGDVVHVHTLLGTSAVKLVTPVQILHMSGAWYWQWSQEYGFDLDGCRLLFACWHEWTNPVHRIVEKKEEQET